VIPRNLGELINNPERQGGEEILLSPTQGLEKHLFEI
jgi:hypothetical protein